jgi:hypothetical protein
MAETTEKAKKAKAPAKPRATVAAKKTTAKATKTEEATTEIRRPSYEEIAALAEQYWRERGHKDGHAEQDWLRAEQELMKKAS